MHLENYAMTPFRDFLLGQIKNRQLTKRAFAELIDIDESSLYRFIKEQNPDRPGDDTLLKISQKLNVQLSELIELRDPGLSEVAHLSARAQLMAQEYENMSIEDRQIIDRLFDSFRRGKSSQAD